MAKKINNIGIFLIVIFALITSFSCSKNNNENSTTTNSISIPNSNNNIRTIELTNDDGNITEFWEYNTDSKSPNLVKSVVDGEIDTSKIALKLVSGDFTDTTIVEGKGGVGFTLQFDNDSSGSSSRSSRSGSSSSSVPLNVQAEATREIYETYSYDAEIVKITGKMTTRDQAGQEVWDVSVDVKLFPGDSTRHLKLKVLVSPY